MKTETGLYYGNIESGVGTILQQKLKQFPNFVSAMVLSVDSTVAPVDIFSIMSFHGIGGRLETGGVLLTSEQIQSAVNAGVFTGFDEVWFLATDKVQRQVPRESHLPDTVDRLLKRLPAFESWLKETQCILALGDGVEHLSYATWDGTIAALIEP